MNNFGSEFNLGDLVKPSGISHAPNEDAEMGLTPDAIGVVNDFSIIDGQVHMVGVLWRELGFESPYLPDEIVKVQP